MKRQATALARLYGLTGPRFHRHMAAALLAGLAPVLYNLVMAVALKDTFAAATAGGYGALACAIAVFALSLAFFFLYNCTTWGVFVSSTLRRTGSVRKVLFGHLCGLPAGEVNRSHSAEAMSLFTSDAAAVENAYGALLRFMIAAVLSGLAAAVLLFARSPAMGIVILSAGAAQLFCNLLLVKPLQSLSGRIAKEAEETGRALSDLLDGNVTIRLYGMQDRMAALYEARSRKLCSLNMRLRLLEGAVKGGNIVTAVASYLLTLAAGAWIASQGSLGLPDLLFLTQARGLVMLIVFTIGDFAQQAQPALASAERLFAFLDKPAEKNQYDSSQ